MPSTWTEFAGGMLLKQYEHDLIFRLVEGQTTLRGSVDVVRLLEALDYKALKAYAMRIIEDSRKQVEGMKKDRERYIKRQKDEDAKQEREYDFSQQIAEVGQKIEAEDADRIHWTAVREAFDAMATAFGGSS